MTEPAFDQRAILPATDTDTERNDVIGLRGLLFSEMRSLPAKATKEQLETAKVKCEIAQTIINSVKVETLYLQLSKRGGSNFIPEKLVNPDKKTE